MALVTGDNATVYIMCTSRHCWAAGINSFYVNVSVYTSTAVVWVEACEHL